MGLLTLLVGFCKAVVATPAAPTKQARLSTSYAKPGLKEFRADPVLAGQERAPAGAVQGLKGLVNLETPTIPGFFYQAWSSPAGSSITRQTTTGSGNDSLQSNVKEQKSAGVTAGSSSASVKSSTLVKPSLVAPSQLLIPTFIISVFKPLTAAERAEEKPITPKLAFTKITFSECTVYADKVTSQRHELSMLRSSVSNMQLSSSEAINLVYSRIR